MKRGVQVPAVSTGLKSAKTLLSPVVLFYGGLICEELLDTNSLLEIWLLQHWLAGSWMQSRAEWG